ncbi:hypothetical protein Hanom_Chr06g00490171 [Helianthus anomalus]
MNGLWVLLIFRWGLKEDKKEKILVCFGAISANFVKVCGLLIVDFCGVCVEIEMDYKKVIGEREREREREDKRIYIK